LFIINNSTRTKNKAQTKTKASTRAKAKPSARLGGVWNVWGLNGELLHKQGRQKEKGQGFHFFNMDIKKDKRKEKPPFQMWII
jgi:hypothetical protein